MYHMLRVLIIIYSSFCAAALSQFSFAAREKLENHIKKILTNLTETIGMEAATDQVNHQELCIQRTCSPWRLHNFLISYHLVMHYFRFITGSIASKVAIQHYQQFVRGKVPKSQYSSSQACSYKSGLAEGFDKVGLLLLFYIFIFKFKRSQSLNSHT